MALTVVMDDAFTDTNGILLTAHTPTTTGTGWTFLTGLADSLDIENNSVGLNNPGDAEYVFNTANVTQTETDLQRVAVVIGPNFNPRNFLMPCTRLQTDTTLAKGYGLEIDTGNSRIRLHRMDNGVRTQIGQISTVTLGNGDSVRYQVDASGTHTVEVDTGSGYVAEVWDADPLVDNTHTGGKLGIAGRRFVSGGAMDSFIGEYDVTSGTPVSFTGNIADQNVIVDVPMTTLVTSTEFSGDILPRTYSISPLGTALPSWASINPTTGDIDGTPDTRLNTTGVIVRCTDDDSNTADSNAFDFIVDSTPWGVLGSEVPSTGADGAALAYASLSLPADNDKRYRITVVTPPASGTLNVNADTSATFDREGGPDGSYVATIKLFEDNVDIGNFTATFTYTGGGIPTIPADSRHNFNAVARYLRTQGYSGHNNDVIVAWLIDTGSLGSFNDMWMNYWGGLGFTGSFEDMHKQWQDSP